MANKISNKHFFACLAYKTIFFFVCYKYYTQPCLLQNINHAHNDKNTIIMKNLTLKQLCLLAVWLMSCSLVAQDIHYSQFYADPLRLNPANTGNFNGDYRFGANARNQWQAVAVPYNTLSGYTDWAFLRNTRSNTPAWLGAGVRLLADQAGDGRLSTYEIQTTIGGHKALTPNLYASIGGGVTWVQKQIDFGQLYFNNQWNEIAFDGSANNQENLIGNRLSYADLQAGGLVSYTQPKRFGVNIGMSVLHVNQPKISFLDGGENRLGVRYIAHINSTITANSRLNIEPAAYFTTQKRAAELVLGSNFAYTLINSGTAYKPKPMKGYIGLWYRHRDAIVPLVGIELSDYRILLSYDINISTLRTATQGRGGLELSLVHVGSFNKLNKSSINCPRF